MKKSSSTKAALIARTIASPSETVKAFAVMKKGGWRRDMFGVIREPFRNYPHSTEETEALEYLTKTMGYTYEPA